MPTRRSRRCPVPAPPACAQAAGVTRAAPRAAPRVRAKLRRCIATGLQVDGTGGRRREDTRRASPPRDAPRPLPRPAATPVAGGPGRPRNHLAADAVREGAPPVRDSSAARLPVLPSARPTVCLPSAVVALFAALPVAAQRTDDPERSAADWLADCRSRSRDWSWNRETACEVRDTTIRARDGRVTIDGGQNGGISVRGWDRDEVRVIARMQAQARSEADARELLRDIRIEAGSTIRADGARARRDEGWSVSFDVYVPRRSNLALETHNGSIRIADVDGDIRLDAVNGSVRL